MAVIEQELTRTLSVVLNWDQWEKLEKAVHASGMSLEEFAYSALLKAADAVPPPSPPAAHSLDGVIGIFKDEPLMEDLMERIRRDRQAEIEAYKED